MIDSTAQTPITSYKAWNLEDNIDFLHMVFLNIV